MNLIYYPDEQTTLDAMAADEPLLILVSFDGAEVLICPLDIGVEHHVVLAHLKRQQLDIDKYFRILVDRRGADWTFVCPPDYKGIEDKTRRIATFYKDGFRHISNTLEQLGYLVGIHIPVRYQRHATAFRGE